MDQDKEKQKSLPAKARDYAKFITKNNHVIYYNSNLYIFNTTHYLEIKEPDIWLRKFFQGQDIELSAALLSLILDEIKSYTHLTGDKPQWIKQDVNNPNPKKLVPYQNCLMDFDSGHILPHNPLLFSTWCLPFDYGKEEICPQWGAFLSSVLPEQSERDLLQEWFGYVLSGDTSRQKFMCLVGLSRSGKSTICSILRKLVGEENSTAFSFSRLIDRFSLSSLIDSPLAIIGEVELDARDRNKVLERFKEVTGNDSVSIERKGKDVFSQVLPTRFTIATNQFPHLYDSAGALAERMLSLRFNISFAGREDLGLLGKLTSELPGIANWALVGHTRLLENGWTIPESSKNDKLAFRVDTSPPLAFLQEHCVVRTDWTTPFMVGVKTTASSIQVSLSDLRTRFDEWVLENDSPLRWNWFMRELRQMIPRMPHDLKRVSLRDSKGNLVQQKVVVGITLK